MVTRWIALAALGLVAPPAGEICRADHHDHMDEAAAPDAAPSSFSAGVSLVAAEYATTYYTGDYQAVAPAVGWSRGRFTVDARIGLYWLSENGADRFGPGDAMLHASATLVARGPLAVAVMLGVMAPTGQQAYGLGMGHAMAMPAACASYRVAPLLVSASVGYNRALADLGGSHHDHGAWPLVDPMNMSELAWSVGAALDVGRGVHVGGVLSGAEPVGAPMGTARAQGGGRASWGTRRVETAVEIQAGIVGDPFTIRGVVETALRF
jgi:hypothetical protein